MASPADVLVRLKAMIAQQRNQQALIDQRRNANAVRLGEGLLNLGIGIRERRLDRKLAQKQQQKRIGAQKELAGMQIKSQQTIAESQNKLARELANLRVSIEKEKIGEGARQFDVSQAWREVVHSDIREDKKFWQERQFDLEDRKLAATIESMKNDNAIKQRMARLRERGFNEELIRYAFKVETDMQAKAKLMDEANQRWYKQKDYELGQTLILNSAAAKEQRRLLDAEYKKRIEAQITVMQADRTMRFNEKNIIPDNKAMDDMIGQLAVLGEYMTDPSFDPDLKEKFVKPKVEELLRYIGNAGMTRAIEQGQGGIGHMETWLQYLKKMRKTLGMETK